MLFAGALIAIASAWALFECWRRITVMRQEIEEVMRQSSKNNMTPAHSRRPRGGLSMGGNPLPPRGLFSRQKKGTPALGAARSSAFITMRRRQRIR